MQAILDACRDGRLDATPRVVISNNSDSRAIERARAEGVPAFHLSRRTHPDAADLDRTIHRTLRDRGVEVVILAGYMRLLGPVTTRGYAGRILNVHPALLPRFGGRGMYGQRVHEAVLAAGETRTGVTIHLADEEYDHGPVIAQCEVAIVEGDTPEILADRVRAVEHRLFVATLQRISRGEIELSPLGGNPPP